MPVYEYLCESHGAFEALRPMAEYAQPCACPACGAQSRRVLLTPPSLGARDRGRMKARAVNERSADSPQRTGAHPPGCGCCSGTKKASTTLYRPDGSKSFPTKRPWMISH